MAKVKVNLSLDSEVAELLKNLAAARHMTTSALVTMWALRDKEEKGNDKERNMHVNMQGTVRREVAKCSGCFQC